MAKTWHSTVPAEKGAVDAGMLQLVRNSCSVQTKTALSPRNGAVNYAHNPDGALNSKQRAFAAPE
jgi:hypothetical protein